MKLSGPMAPPKAGGTPKQAVVLLHGYGSDGHDLIGLAGYWRDRLPNAMFVAPNGPEACDVNPGGYQWFAIDFDRPGYRVEGADAVRPVITQFLEDMWAQTGLTPAQTVLAGFSQGAMMALNVGLSLDKPLAGILSFSGALVAPKGFLDREGPKPPVCLVHGDSDSVVDPDLSEQAFALLKGKGFEVTYHVEAGGAHTISQGGLDVATRFIEDVLATA